MDIIPIAILASDPITWEGSVALLSAHPDLLILPPELRPQDRRQCGYDQIAYAIKAADALQPGAGWRTAAARNP